MARYGTAWHSTAQHIAANKSLIQAQTQLDALRREKGRKSLPGGGERGGGGEGEWLKGMGAKWRGKVESRH